MGKRNWTPGPWLASNNGTGLPWFIFQHSKAKPKYIAECPASSGEANAARIVACVNNCEGINPEAVPEMLQALKQVAMYSRICHMVPKDYGDLVAAAIAKAEGRE